jgi:hypothetical protein
MDGPATLTIVVSNTSMTVALMANANTVTDAGHSVDEVTVPASMMLNESGRAGMGARPDVRLRSQR